MWDLEEATQQMGEHTPFRSPQSMMDKGKMEIQPAPNK